MTSSTTPNLSNASRKNSRGNNRAVTFKELIAQYYDDDIPLGARQIMKLRIELAQTSCGYGVPIFDYQGERTAIENWHENKGPDGIKSYWEEENLSSMDGLLTGLKLDDD